MQSLSNLSVVSTRQKGGFHMIKWRLACEHHSLLRVSKLPYFGSKLWNQHGAATLLVRCRPMPSPCLAPGENCSSRSGQVTHRSPISHLPTATEMAGNWTSPGPPPIWKTSKDNPDGGQVHRMAGKQVPNQHRQEDLGPTEGSHQHHRVEIDDQEPPARCSSPCPSPCQASQADPCTQNGASSLGTPPSTVDTTSVVKFDVHR